MGIKKFYILLLFIFTQNVYAYLSYGNASDNCNWSTSQTLTKAVWNCDDFTVDAGVVIDFASSVTSVVQFRVQGIVSISGRIDVSATTTSPGPGGSAGGDCGVGVCDEVDANGSTGAEGQGGGKGTHGGVTVLGNGGGGGGGGYSAAGDAGGTVASGGTSGTAGATSASFVTAASLSSNLLGGIGGGASGSGEDGANIANGADGGNGAGSFAIISKGNITLTGTAQLWAKGEQGKNGVSSGLGSTSGNGGGGSGGAIYLVTGGTLTTSNTAIDISGGSANTNGSNATGGKGSNGIFRVDTLSGAFSGNFSSAPNLTSTTLSSILDPVGSSSSLNKFNSDIEASCTYKINDSDYYLMGYNFLFGVFFILLLFKSYKFCRKLIITNMISMPKT